MTVVVADTTCSLPRHRLAELGVPFVAQVVIFGEEAYHDDAEFQTSVFLQKLKASASLPKTAAPEPALYHPIFAAAQEQNESVVVVAPSGKVSGTVRSAQSAAQDFPGLDVRVIDTLTVSCNLGAMVLEAHDLARAGGSADAIQARLEQMIPRGRLYFVVDTLEYLARGGRIGGARALLGELIQIKPILTIRYGQAEACEQPRTRKRAIARLEQIAATQCPASPQAHLAVIQVAAEDEAAQLAARLKAVLHLPEVPVYELPPAIVVHGGPGTIGLGFFAQAAAASA